MQNVEFKAELRDAGLARAICKALKATWVANLEQKDTYYRVATGRLKRRECVGEPVEYIHYERPNRAAPKISQFTIYTENQARERFGREALPVWVTVRKKRELFVLGHTRIHLDEVEGLGTFIEIEAIVSPHHHVGRCHESIAKLRAALSPAMGEVIDCSYADLAAREDHLAA